MESLLKKDLDLWKSYQRDKNLCKKAGQNQLDCEKLVALKYLRKLPGMNGLVYPWVNYDWNYQQYINNTYNKDKTGVTDAGTFGALFKNPVGMVKIAKGILTDPDPPSNAISAKTDNPICKPNDPNYQGCKIMNGIRESVIKQKAPYKDRFFDKPLNGQHSSSYFIQSGVCPQPKIGEKECKEKGYEWIPNPLYEATPAYLRPSTFLSGSCYKRNYGYVKNLPGIKIDFNQLKKVVEDASKVLAKSSGAGMFGSVASKGVGAALDATGPLNDLGQNGVNTLNKVLANFNGELPSLVNDGLSLSPFNIEMVAKGESNPYFENQKCEAFIGSTSGLCGANLNRQGNSYWSIILFLLILVSIVLFIAIKFRNFSEWTNKN